MGYTFLRIGHAIVIDYQRRLYILRLRARNQLRGKIVSVQQGIVNALVTLDANGVLVSANITKASAQELGLEPGKDAIAVIKSTEVMIGLEKVRLSVRNQFAGKITSIELGAVNSIVRVAIEGGNTITSVISIASVKELGLKEGQDVYVVIKATSVMVGVED